MATGVDGDAWDFFISYTQADRVWAEWIAWELEATGFRVLVQAWDFVPGTNWIQSMQEGVTRAQRTIAVLSDDYLKSVFGGAEWRATWVKDPQGKGRRLLPVRVSDCERPGMLAGVVGVDLFGVDEAKARSRLRDMIDRAVAGRAKPTKRPGFPGSDGRAMSREARFPGALPAVWNVPARNPHFTGRVDALAALGRDLSAGATVTVQSVRGMGGVGKTQLVNEYAHGQATRYDLVWWVPAEEPALIGEHFARLADRLGVESQGEPEVVRDAVHEALRQVSGWLLIFDNAEAAEHVGPWLPVAPLRPGIPGHVLVTTRRGGFRQLGHVHDLDVVDVGEAVELMRGRVPDLPREVGEAIAEEVGRLPLALEQAAAYIDRTQTPPGEYLDMLTGHVHELYFAETMSAQDRRVAGVWSLSLDRLAVQSPAARQLLDICAYLAPEPIPLDLFTGHPDELPEPLSAAAGDALTFNEVIAAIVDFSLAKRATGGLQLHRLVQAALRSRFAAADRMWAT